MWLFIAGYTAVLVGLASSLISLFIKNETTASKFKIFGIAVSFGGLIYILIAVAGGDPPDDWLNYLVGPAIAAIMYLALGDIWKWFKDVHATISTLKRECPLFEKK
ncbi:MAG: hypothetical protein J7L58_03705 [Thermoplasmata archaeon]|nr:hypothetical protein [Thermoplasmata archaeon]